MLEQRLNELAATGLLMGSAALGPAIRKAALEMAHDQATANVALCPERAEGFLLAVAAGLPVSAAAVLAGVSRRTLYYQRAHDPEFAEQWEDAREASLGQVESRMESIALQGEPGSMATVRAAEALVRIRQREPKARERATNAEPNRPLIIWEDDGLTPR